MRVLTADTFSGMLREALADNFLSTNEEADLTDAAETNAFLPSRDLGELNAAIDRYEERAPALEADAEQMRHAAVCLATGAECVEAGPASSWGGATTPEAVAARALDLPIQAGRATSIAQGLQRVLTHTSRRQATVRVEEILAALNQRADAVAIGRNARAQQLLDRAVSALNSGMELGRPFYDALAASPSAELQLREALSPEQLDAFEDFLAANVAER